MKNKFKKSKIIVPALALITATTVASVTGTVAWFTASRQITVTASKFQTTTLNSNLIVECEGYGNTGTATTSETDNTGIKFEGLLTHGSYNASVLQNTGNDKGKTGTDAKLFVPTMDSSSVTGFVSQGRVEDQHANQQLDSDNQTVKVPEKNDWKAGSQTASGSSKDIWYAVAWKMTFKQEANKDSGTNVNTLHFDPKTTTFTDGTTGGETINGFRIALMTETQYYVAAGDNEKKHVSQATSTTVDVNQAQTDYANIVNVATSDFSQPADGTKTELETTNNYYLGEIDPISGLIVIAVAWFEGCDSNIVTSKENGASTVMSDVTANLAFFSRKATA